MHPDPTKRLGGSEADANDIMKHPFFIDVDWTAISEKREKPSFRPVTKGGRDTSNIDKAFLAERPVDSPVNNQLTFS